MHSSTKSLLLSVSLRFLTNAIFSWMVKERDRDSTHISWNTSASAYSAWYAELLVKYSVIRDIRDIVLSLQFPLIISTTASVTETLL